MQNLLQLLFVLLISGLSCFIIAYLKQKGINRALLENNEKLQRQNNEIKSEFDIKMELIRKNHDLEVSKRKYQYEMKQEEFKKYLLFMDQFNKNCEKSLKEEFLPIISKFHNDYYEASGRNDSEGIAKSLQEFSSAVLSFSLSLDEERRRIGLETNTIKLVCPNDILELIIMTENAMEKSLDLSVQMMKLMGSPNYIVDNTILEPVQNELTCLGGQILEMKSLIIEKMRLHLGTI